MASYNEEVRAHFFAPLNSGRLFASNRAVVYGHAGARHHGREVEFQLQVTPEHRVIDCRYRVYGCPATIALCSLASEALKGRLLAEAAAFSVMALADELQLPAEKRDAAIVVEDAIRAAALRYNDVQAPSAAARLEQMQV